jgi:DNA-binding transcriptional LysR family regulator
MAFKRNQLLYFITIADEGQITRAAAKLHIAQPALSYAIGALESELGIELFERHARGVTLTPAGHTLLGRARLALAAEADAEGIAESLRQGVLARITIGYIGVPPELTNADLVAAFKQAHPQVQIVPHELPFPSTPTAAWLANVDVAIASRPADDPDVWTLPLRQEQRVVLVPRSHDLAERDELCVADLVDETFIGFHPAVEPAWAATWSLDDHRNGSPPRLAERSINAQERFALIAAGSGIATLPACHASIIASILPSVVAIPIRDADPTTLTLVGARGRLTPAVQDLRAVAQDLSGEKA